MLKSTPSNVSYCRCDILPRSAYPEWQECTRLPYNYPPSVGMFRGKLHWLGQAVFTLKTCSGLENVVRTSFSMSGSVGLTPVITVGAM